MRTVLQTHSTRRAPLVASGRGRSYAIIAMDQPATRTTSADYDSHTHVAFDDGMALECGAMLRRLTVAFRTYGTLNAERSNAILVCHALTGDQYVAEPHPVTNKPGWWEAVVGPGRPVRHQPLFRHLLQRAGRLYGQHGPAQQPRTAGWHGA